MKLQDKVIHWLLEDENPVVRYLTLTKLLKKSERASEVQQAKAHLMEYEVTQGILKHSKEIWRGFLLLTVIFLTFELSILQKPYNFLHLLPNKQLYCKVKKVAYCGKKCIQSLKANDFEW